MKRSFPLMLLISIVMCSCSVYYPNLAIPTHFEEKGDVSVAGAVSLNAIDAKAAYSPIQNFYIHASGTYNIEYSSNTHHSYGGGLGCYYPLSEKLFVEGQVEYVRGNFKYDDIFNRGSGGTQLVHAKGYYNSLGAFGALYYNASESLTLGMVYKAALPDLFYQSADPHWLSGQSYTKWQHGLHFYLQINYNEHTGLFASAGPRYVPDKGFQYLNSPFVVLRMGMQYKF